VLVAVKGDEALATAVLLVVVSGAVVLIGVAVGG